jgi:predicted GH43/DUF377 family glycosyl hydrolase
MTQRPTVTPTGIELRPDGSRVITRFFVPGREDLGPGDSRAGPVVQRLLGLDERDVEDALRDVHEQFAHRHRDLDARFLEHAAMVTSRVGESIVLSDARRLLVGASFTHEYSIEGAALCNPCAVPFPGADDGEDTTFVLSLRGIGEGHRSSIGFRTGTVTAAGKVTIDPPGPYPVIADPTPGRHDRAVFHAKLAELDDDRENAAFVLDPLPSAFDDAALDDRITELATDMATRRRASTTINNLRTLARSSYRVEFPGTDVLSERVLWPHAPAESHGMEDARFVRFLDDDGSITYFGTYTAYDGAHVNQHLIETTDFRSFEMSPMAGMAATGKGLALFPRRIGGRYAALSRADRETNAIAFTDDLRFWPTSETIQVPERPWELLQLGNCGSPIETEAGWLVLTHGVGPMRTYSLGALLLDLDEPARVIGRSEQPILAPGPGRREGYVPNVVYTCGGFAHGDVLVLPYGVADQTVEIATLSISELVASLT